MSTSSRIASVGFNRLLPVSGEQLTFRGAGLVGIVNRTARDYQAGAVKIDLNDGSSSIIQVRLRDVSGGTNPKNGETFSSADGYIHKVTRVRVLGEVVSCECRSFLTT